jgi:hypothetical protein
VPARPARLVCYNVMSVTAWLQSWLLSRTVRLHWFRLPGDGQKVAHHTPGVPNRPARWVCHIITLLCVTLMDATKVACCCKNHSIFLYSYLRIVEV